MRWCAFGALLAGGHPIAARLREEVRNEWVLGLAGIISVLFGGFVLVSPGAGALALVWLVAVRYTLQTIQQLVDLYSILMRCRCPRDRPARICLSYISRAYSPASSGQARAGEELQNTSTTSSSRIIARSNDGAPG